jgi:hypothetical protein
VHPELHWFANATPDPDRFLSKRTLRLPVRECL